MLNGNSERMKRWHETAPVPRPIIADPVPTPRGAPAGAQGHRLVAGGDLTTRRDVAAAIIARHRIVSVAIQWGALLFGAGVMSGSLVCP
uniref:Uncharacterized protein n=1 Tax=Oryza rufipogon TaxID=4529 RepID=A0A0E0NY24_ORYRU